MSALRIVSLASGSTGNAYVVCHGEAALLIDCGICWKTLSLRLKDVCEPKMIQGILITHDHSDHVGGLPVFLKHVDVPVFANALTAEAIAHERKVAESAFCCFENGQEFDIGPFRVHPFSIPHDTADPVGYRIQAGGETYFHGTDIGAPLDSIGMQLTEADVATLESNHDPVLLRRSGRPPVLIQRIIGPRGHLSNDQACELVQRFAAPKLKRLALAHLSRDCNAPHMARNAMRDQLKALHREDVALHILGPDEVVSF